MSTGAIVAVVVVALLVIATAIAAVLRPRLHSNRLRKRFGPEYDRAVAEHGSTVAAERELEERLRRHRHLDLRPLSADAREAYRARWGGVQKRFVDAPREALVEADRLLTEVMHDRGYPSDEHEEKVAALSVRHADTLQSYRDAHAVAERARAGTATTEELREAVIRTRELFRELVEEGPADSAEPPVDGARPSRADRPGRTAATRRDGAGPAAGTA